jgi:hypothetical protein
MLTPHLAGMLSALPATRPPTLAAADLRQLQAARRSAVVLAAELRLRTPLQQAGEGALPLPRA